MPAIRCPSCQARYQVSAKTAGRRAKCKQCGQAFRIPEFRRPAEEEELRLADVVPGSAAAAPAAGAAPGGTVMAEAILTEDSVGYAAGDVPDVEVVRGAYAGYLQSLAWSLCFPRHMGSLITFIIVWVIMLIGGFVGSVGGCIGLVGSLIVTGWYMSFQLNVVASAAGGEEELPTLALTEGWWDDIVAPFLKMLCTYVLACLPVLVYSLALGATGGLLALLNPTGGGVGAAGVAQYLIGQLVLMLLGFFVWPMLVLVVACGDFGGLLRPDLMARTILRSLPAYLVVVAAVYISTGMTMVCSFLVAVIPPNLNSIPQWLAVVIVLPTLATLVELYLAIVAMRAIGLYYHHFKHRFAWTWG